MHHKLSSLLALLEELVELLPIEEIVCIRTKLENSEECSISGCEMRELKISSSESFAETVRKRLLHLDLILRRQIRPEQLDRVDSIVIQPRLCRLKMHNQLSKLVQDVANIILM